MALNPCCCGISLQTGTKVIAFLQIIGALAIFLTSILGIVGIVILSQTELDNNETSEQREIRKTAEIILIIIASLLIVGSVIAFFLAIVLWKGASQRNASKCRIWTVVSSVILFIFVVAFIVECVNVQTGDALKLVQSGVTILVDSYCIFVVYCFRKEIKEEDSEA